MKRASVRENERSVREHSVWQPDGWRRIPAAPDWNSGQQKVWPAPLFTATAVPRCKTINLSLVSLMVKLLDLWDMLVVVVVF